MLTLLIISIIAFYILCYIGCMVSLKFQYYARFILYYFLVTMAGAICIPIFIFRPRRLDNYKIPMFFLRLFSTSLNVKPQIRGIEYLNSEESMIVCCNHQSSIDMFGAGFIWPSNCTVLAKKSLLYAGPFGFAAWLCKCIFIDRGNREKALQVMAGVAKQISEEKTKLFIFPEGTRRCGTELLPFKKGAFHLAIEGQIPIVPVVFSSYLPFLNHSVPFFTEGSFMIDILPPIPTAGMTTKDVNQLLDDTRKVMQETFQRGIAENYSKSADDLRHEN